MYVQDLTAMLDAAGSLADPAERRAAIDRVTEIVASGDVQHVHPYPLKVFLVRYAREVQRTTPTCYSFDRR